MYNNLGYIYFITYLDSECHNGSIDFIMMIICISFYWEPIFFLLEHTLIHPMD